MKLLLLKYIGIIISHFVSASHTEVQRVIARLLSECLLLRDGTLYLPDCFSRIDINDIIMDLCVN